MNRPGCIALRADAVNLNLIKLLDMWRAERRALVSPLEPSLCKQQKVSGKGTVFKGYKVAYKPFKNTEPIGGYTSISEDLLPHAAERAACWLLLHCYHQMVPLPLLWLSVQRLG